MTNDLTGDMMTALVSRISGWGTYANVTSSLALILALGGTSYAAVTLPRNSVGSSQIRNRAVAGDDIRSDAVTSDKVRDGTLLSADFKAGQILAGPRGPTGAKGDQGVPGPKGDAGPSGASIFDAAIPSGATIRGVWGGLVPAPNATTFYTPRIGFPIPAPVGLTVADVKFAAGTANVLPANQDANCTGSVDVPTAPAGRICVYVDHQGANVTDLIAAPLDGDGTNQSKLGFGVQITATGGPGLSVLARGTWAYTAP